MADEEDNIDYESDPDEVKMSLKMRRREASDDENDVVDDDGSEAVDSRGESDGQGGAADYDDDENDVVEDEAVYYDEYEEDEAVEVYSEVEEREIRGQEEVDKADSGSEAKSKVEGEGGQGEEGDDEKGDVEESEKKEVEPFSVPTSGAFYMHDDRFRGNAAPARHRRTFDGKKLWESKDEKKWGHDKFEELNLQDRHYDEGRRSSRGSYRGREKPRGASSSRGSRGRGYSGDKNQNAPPKNVRGRGPRRYQRLVNKKGDTQPAQYKQSARSFDKSSHTGSGRTATSTGSSNVEHEAASSKRVGSNLSSASPPFYPSGASAKDTASTQKKEMHTGNHNRNMLPSADPNFSMSISNPIIRGKNIVDPMGIDKLHIDDTISPANSKAIDNLHLQSSESSSLTPTQFANPRVQGRVVASSKPSMFQPPQMNNQVSKISSQAKQPSKRSPAVTQGQSPLQAPGQQLTQHTLLASQSLSPPKAGKGVVQGTGTGSLVYGGAQVMGSGGNVSAGRGDPNVPGFFPVMQFGGQHPGGMGVPAVGMAFPGYVAQPKGLGNSEMTWLPMLANAAGAMGATYCPPYLSVDGSYHSRPSGQTSTLPASGKDNSLSKPNNEIRPQQRPEVANDELSQRQNKPRRTMISPHHGVFSDTLGALLPLCCTILGLLLDVA
ncbi:hypothetical protein KSS87_022638 [Heliosperma pusillum]|nr:hypothetical protein KSS87_022638 [Heliosperma pusillum]